jgi:hypothetical protein
MVKLVSASQSAAADEFPGNFDKKPPVCGHIWPSCLFFKEKRSISSSDRSNI